RPVGLEDLDVAAFGCGHAEAERRVGVDDGRLVLIVDRCSHAAMLGAVKSKGVISDVSAGPAPSDRLICVEATPSTRSSARRCSGGTRPTGRTAARPSCP